MRSTCVLECISQPFQSYWTSIHIFVYKNSIHMKCLMFLILLDKGRSVILNNFQIVTLILASLLVVCFKGSVSRDLLPLFFCWKDSTWAHMNRIKRFHKLFLFSWRYSITKLENHMTAKYRIRGYTILALRNPHFHIFKLLLLDI